MISAALSSHSFLTNYGRSRVEERFGEDEGETSTALPSYSFLTNYGRSRVEERLGEDEEAAVKDGKNAAQRDGHGADLWIQRNRREHH